MSARGFTTLSRKVGMGTAVRAQWWLRTRCELIVRATGANLLAASITRCVPIVRTLLRTSLVSLAPTENSRSSGA